MNEVVESIQASSKWPDGEWTNSRIAEETTIDTAQVRNLMKELDEEGYVSHRRGRGNKYHWSNECFEEFTAFGDVS